ncbi:EpsG family protein [Enterococcus viikkiensis]|uniref:EpsG family protein n=1 Tax=Enterococcus viikkiensis TaxID=930854 RepID=A0ABU3FNH6_9ENTE|nr:EpsG family protein [Enterococcus viikkiensis]MDT2827203.1 EpsG family protein [Enterococcus viikkiensis]
MGVTQSFILFLGIFLLSTILINIGNRKIGAIRNFFIIIGLLLPVLLSTFRTVGTDYGTYLSIFNHSSDLDLLTMLTVELGYKEIGNTVIIWIASILGSFRWYLFIYSSATIVLTYNALKKLSPENITISYFVYLTMYFTQSMNIIRQSLAVAIIFYGYYYLIQRDLKKYLVICIIATSFHMSALIAFPLFFFLDENNNIRKKLFIVFSFFLIFAVLNYEKFFLFIGGINSFGFDRYTEYASYSGSIDTNNKIFFMNLFIFLIVFIFRKKMFKNDKLYFFYYLMIVGLIFGISGFFSPYLKRLSLYSEIVYIVVLPMLTDMFEGVNEKILLKYLLFISCVMYFFIAYTWLKFGAIIPYETFF